MDGVSTGRRSIEDNNNKSKEQSNSSPTKEID
jgi:hypothetical protein